MKKLNNRGFAISTLLYGLLIVAILVVFTLLNIISFNKKTTSDFVNVTEKELLNLSNDIYNRVSTNKFCKLATTLHSDVCYKTLCNSLGSKVTYGQLGTKGILKIGDAYDCDINGDGTFDGAAERFYYIGKQEDNGNLFMYYNNIDDETTIYNSMELSGPSDAQELLPNDSQSKWKNMKNALVSLGNRKIYDRSKNLITNFQYKTQGSKVFARLPSLSDIKNVSPVNMISHELVKKEYAFLLEGTNFTSDFYDEGYWLEDYDEASSMPYSALYIDGINAELSYRIVVDGELGVRPVTVFYNEEIEGMS